MGLEFASFAHIHEESEESPDKAGPLTPEHLLEFQPFCPGCGCRLQRNNGSSADFAHAIPHGLACRRCRKKVRLTPPLIETPPEKIPDRPREYFIPTEAEIAEACAEIRKGWTEAEHRFVRPHPQWNRKPVTTWPKTWTSAAALAAGKPRPFALVCPRFFAACLEGAGCSDLLF